MLQRQVCKKFIFIFIFLITALVFISDSAMSSTGWNLALNGRVLGDVPIKEQGRLTMVSIGTMVRLLQLDLEQKEDTLLIYYKNNKLQLVHKATAVWLNVQLLPTASAPVLENGHWWLDSRSAMKILQSLYQAAGDKSTLSWMGASDIPVVIEELQPLQEEIKPAIQQPVQQLVQQPTCELKSLRWGRYEEKIRVVFDYLGVAEPESKEVDTSVSIVFSGSSLSQNDLSSPYPQDVSVKMNTLNGKYIVSLHSVQGGKMNIFTLPNPTRLVVDIFPEKQKEILEITAPGGNIPESQNVSVPQRVAVPPQKKSKKPLIVVDPGHGGKDPGAVSNGLREKNLNLQFSKLLAESIKKRGFDVRLTRSTDIYLKLRERTELANNWEADMFISIHANALPKGRHATGTEIYIMALPTDKDAMQLALIENRELTGDNGSESSAQVDKKTKMLLNILGNMQQNAKISDSTDVAEYLFKAGKNNRLNMRRVAQAPFFVLRGASMPAVLIETGFITERSEAKKLASTSFQRQFAEAIARGVEAYFNGGR